jgi:hypothetical protein
MARHRGRGVLGVLVHGLVLKVFGDIGSGSLVFVSQIPYLGLPLVLFTLLTSDG